MAPTSGGDPVDQEHGKGPGLSSARAGNRARATTPRRAGTPASRETRARSSRRRFARRDRHVRRRLSGATQAKKNAGPSNARYMTPGVPGRQNVQYAGSGACTEAMPGQPPTPARRQRGGNREAAELDGQLHDVHPGGCQQSAGGEVHGDRRPPPRRPRRTAGRRPRRGVVPDGNQLAGENRDGAEPEQRGHRAAHTAAVPELEVVANGVADVEAAATDSGSRAVQNASTSDPVPADPTHHHADTPCEYPMPVAPTVDPAPMLAASIVEKMRPGPSCRPATKKSDAPRTSADQRPSTISASEMQQRGGRGGRSSVNSVPGAGCLVLNAGARRARLLNAQCWCASIGSDLMKSPSRHGKILRARSGAATCSATRPEFT